VRGALVGIVLGLVVVFAIAVRLNPYEADGAARRMETHRQLGLPPCTFYAVTNYPCPACGMTTSFSLLMHGSVLGALQANCVGALLATFCLLFIPWGVVGAVRGQAPFIRSLEGALMVVVLVLLTLMMLRWAIVVALTWWYSGMPVRF
jgi:hypothetical protein